MKAIFMGTPDIAATILKSVIESKHEILAVVTQPDKPKGRSQGKLSFPPVKEVALEHQIPVLQPQKVKEEAFLEEIRKLNPDIILVAAYGKLLPKALLELPRFGCINVHASLLPKYRGASPIQWAVLNGEEKSGVTIMYMTEALDAGDMIATEEVELSKEETAGSLHDKLAQIGGPLLLSAMEAIEAGNVKRTPQNEEEATYVTMLDKAMGNLNFSKSAIELERFVRGLNPWPTAYTKLHGKMLKIWKAEVASEMTLSKEQRQQEFGTIVTVEKDKFGILTGEGILVVRELQLEGKRRMTVEEFLRGASLEIGTLLGR